MVSKCGKHVTWHWAHATREHCDQWWESETPWHRQWKDYFPFDWQEVVLKDEKGERHIADVRTPAGLVLEFQRSTIHPDEVHARETYYQKMVWVVDGSRSEFDATYFTQGLYSPDEEGRMNFTFSGRSKLFARWHTTKPVFIDFGEKFGFWRVLHFDPASKRGIAGPVSIPEFVKLASSGTSDFSKGGGPASPFRKT